MGFWNQFEGQLLDGQFKLSNYSGAAGPSAVFLSELPGQDQFATVKIIRSASLEAPRLAGSWKIAKDLQHPNLIRVYATATADLDGLRVLYAVLESSDASLADVIQKHCLNEEEGRELLAGCAEALHYLHQKGFVHTCVRPANIVAVDETTKLSTDSLFRSAEKEKGPPQPDHYDAPEVQTTGNSPATDIWALGVTLFEALTQGLPTGNTDPQLRSLPGPFSEIIEHCLDPKPTSRWSARQILSYLQSGAVAAKPNLATIAMPSAERPPAAPDPGERTPPISPPTPDELPKPTLLKRWGVPIKTFIPLRYAVCAVLIVLCLGWLTRTSQTDRPASGTAGAAGFAVPSPRPLPVDRKPEIKPSPFDPSAHVAGPTSGTAERARTIWRVVAYTYASAQGAQAKVREINAKSPQLHARVLSLPGERSHMVVVGGEMTRVEATNLRKRLLEDGFPPDTYIQNFSQ